MTNPRHWWQDGAIYQIYPRSFEDSNADGVGDLPGILDRLDYLVDLGIAAIWISPFYPSPMADFGYDVADYTGVDPLFGTLADFDRLIEAAHAKGLRVILDFVPNHSSDRHPWFLESRSSKDNPKRGWYLWRDPGPDGRPPNNWMSQFGGPAWTFDALTGQYYCHSFLKEQPDLNWHNPQVREAIYAAMRFWLDKGVDGFRMDVLWLLIKDDQFRDNPPNPDWRPGDSTSWMVLPRYTADQPETHLIVAEMRAVMDKYPERVLIGEIYLPLSELVRYYGQDLTGAQMPFNFRLIQAEWRADPIADLIREYEALLPQGAWPNWVMGNHDQRRLASRLGPAQARTAAVLLLTLRGTPTMYYGDELGLPDAHIAPDQVQDPAEKNQPGIGQGRDPERSPMLWDRTPGAGFTTGRPWLPFAADPATASVAAQDGDPASMLTLYRCLLALRRELPALHAGSIEYVFTHDGVLGYVRREGAERVQVMLNLTNEWRHIDFPAGRLLLSSAPERELWKVVSSFDLRPAEAVVVALP
ncbi:alpha-glucosidase [Granulicella rosea]|uniref:Alpha-glucosidase n=1 Tax=Granulicella rosea TaxID=474952 RepID=A0A239CTI0_9BACT|nr:alpha-amylase family glycosyl hydrolase [Granulicella rosea]SNS23078.1 alpha-glucosidase [Granulicella rosea]